MDGFDFLRDAFKKIAGQLDGQDLTGRVVRAAGAGAKSAAERGMKEFPHDFIKNTIDNAYAGLVSSEMAEGISRSIRSFDEQKIQDVLDKVVQSMKEDRNAAALAKQLKEILKQADNDQLEGVIEQLIPQDRYSERMIFKALFMQARPILDDMRTMDEAQLAETIKELADTIPTDMLAMQVGALTREFTPERILDQAQAAVGKLPSGGAIADIVHGVGNSAIKHFDAVAKSRNLQDAANAYDAFKAEAKAIVNGQISADNDAKKNFDNKGKGGGKFKF